MTQPGTEVLASLTTEKPGQAAVTSSIPTTLEITDRTDRNGSFNNSASF